MLCNCTRADILEHQEEAEHYVAFCTQHTSPLVSHRMRGSCSWLNVPALACASRSWGRAGRCTVGKVQGQEVEASAGCGLQI
jgi:hypothetical protein